MSKGQSSTLHADGPFSVQGESTYQGPTLEERAAYHEAGHFVASVHLRRKLVRRVSIVPDYEQEIQGDVNHGKFDSFFKRLEYVDPEDPNLRYFVEREIILCLAGEAAEVVFLGHTDPDGLGGDREGAMELATRMFPGS